jgi:inhibitor of KinA sporulation pathway (predicted exonuclease)
MTWCNLASSLRFRLRVPWLYTVRRPPTSPRHRYSDNTMSHAGQSRQRQPEGAQGAPNRNHQYRRRQDAPLVLPATEKVLVIDLEATCWESNGAKPVDEQHEIIEVGWAVVDVPSNALLRTGTILVKPVHSCISTFCTQLTTITQELVDTEGVTLKEAFDFLVDEVGSKSVSWASYGEYDKNMVRRQCRVFGLQYPFGETHTNVKTLFKEVYSGYRGNYGMATAYKAVFGKGIEGTHHRGGDDAKNIAVMLGELLKMRKESN